MSLNTARHLAALGLLLSPGIAFVQQPPAGVPPLPAARNIPGVTVEDIYPRGCVDCHVHLQEMNVDARLSVQLTDLTRNVEAPLLEKARAAAGPEVVLHGTHPSLPIDTFADVPRSCLVCHGSDSVAAPTMARLTHLIHLTGAPNVFMSIYQGECTHCHKLEQSTGRWFIPSGPERPQSASQ